MALFGQNTLTTFPLRKGVTFELYLATHRQAYTQFYFIVSTPADDLNYEYVSLPQYYVWDKALSVLARKYSGYY